MTALVELRLDINHRGKSCVVVEMKTKKKEASS